ncbi:folate transporter 1, putative [Plasmodium berghei]|uniref:Folate transporter 1, putative n=2 Tax=Plasmodium berghei TaxID=5821 RepID=A0A509AMF9_PLABA|nr:folate transporter 1, putative [Plasmodium berghei ANKA]CXI22706.1 folate transporter 1, putative [Plasmodium berghei]SCM20125.1 folate transporter 1, putative [Plasmodium berghei]SCN23770.1 folate transporter 1, putative [Plasmodium berghei]SCO59228.1 folate transporter 1, putative [Plasmodium berghei]SCO60135.1 folate transporter 1, putative [Plasmodium berghei]|eukprot:XP_034420767.1 folate transporter 1, putative [Plasmodium berghei ANKA]
MEKEKFTYFQTQNSYETCSTSTVDSFHSFTESKFLIKKKPNEDDDQNANSISNKFSSSFIAMLQGVEVLCNLPILYIFKDSYQLHPATLNMLMSIIKIPWAIKLLWGIISDTYPIFGYRRKYYLIFGSGSCILSLLILGLISHTNIFLTILLLVMYFFGSSLCNVIGEAQVIESSRKGSVNTTVKNISIFFAFRKIGFAIMHYLSGYLLSIMSNQHIFLISSILPLSIFISAFFVVEKRNYKKCNIKKQIKSIYEIIKKSYIQKFILFIFIMMSTPSSGSILFFFMANELQFTPKLLGKISMFQSLASLLAILLYMLILSKVNIKKLLLYSTIIIAPFSLLPLLAIHKINIFIPNTLFIITDTILVEFIGELQSIPILVQCSRIIPEGFESTIYSFLLSVNNFAVMISSFISSILTYQLGITSTNFDNLSKMIIICCLTNIIPIIFLYNTTKFYDDSKHCKSKDNNILNSSDNESTFFDSTSYEIKNCEEIKYFITENGHDIPVQ